MPFTPSGAPVLAPFALDPDEAREFLEDSARPPYVNEKRYLVMQRREAHWKGRQYAHQEKDWWGTEADHFETISPMVEVPGGFERMAPEVGLSTREKRPSIETGTVATIVEGYTDLMLSEQSCPLLTVEQDADTEAMLHAFALDGAYWQKWAYARDMGGGVGSVVVTWHARDGKIDMEVHNAKQVIPLWRNRRQWLPAAILKFWTVKKTEDVLDPKTGRKVGEKEVEYCYRRIISEVEDVVYKPIRLDDPETWAWVVDPALSVRHDLGRFPGVWVQNTPNDDDKDGDPDCEGAWKQVDAYDRLMSQMNKGNLAFVDPTLVIADDPKEAPGGMGGSVKVGSDNTLELTEKGKAELLEATGAGLEAASKFCDRLERVISQRTGFVFVDPKDVGGSATSSLTLKMMFRSMIQRADKKRGQYGPAIVKGFEVVEAIARSFVGKKVPLPPAEDGTERVGVFAFRLPKRSADVAGPDGSTKVLVEQQLGPGGNITLKWGPYFDKSPAEEGQDITNAVAAKTGGLVDADTAIRHVASEIFQVRDVDSMAARIASEQAEETERMLQQAAASFPVVGAEPAGAGGAAPGHQNGALANRDKPDERAGGTVQ